MKCPDCKGDLDPKRFGAIEVDLCDRCGGQWFDEGEFEHVRKDLLVPGRLSFTPSQIPGGQCPRCIAERLTSGYVGVAWVERCTSCEGIWVQKPTEAKSGSEVDKAAEGTLSVLDIVAIVLTFFP